LGKEYLLQRGVDEEAASYALAQFAAIMETETFRKNFDPASAHPLFASAVEEAELGDPTRLQSLINGSCRSYD